MHSAKSMAASAASLAIGTAFLVQDVNAATFVIVNNDGPGEGFNDPTPVSPIGGNPGTTLGQQRLNCFIRAGEIWGAILQSNVNITIDDCFMIRGLKVIKGTKGLFVAMPNKKGKNGSFRDVAHPLNSETRQLIEDEVLRAYYNNLEQEPELMAANE